MSGTRPPSAQPQARQTADGIPQHLFASRATSDAFVTPTPAERAPLRLLRPSSAAPTRTGARSLLPLARRKGFMGRAEPADDTSLCAASLT